MSFSVRLCILQPSVYNVLFVLYALLVDSSRAACYYPSGLEPVIPGAFTACNSNSNEVSMCCNSENGDKCTKEGLCQSRSNAFYRDLCTDSTWAAPECVKICLGISQSVDL